MFAELLSQGIRYHRYQYLIEDNGSWYYKSITRHLQKRKAVQLSMPLKAPHENDNHSHKLGCIQYDPGTQSLQ